jgi:hypothetical protein
MSRTNRTERGRRPKASRLAPRGGNQEQRPALPRRRSPTALAVVADDSLMPNPKHPFAEFDPATRASARVRDLAAVLAAVARRKFPTFPHDMTRNTDGPTAE